MSDHPLGRVVYHRAYNIGVPGMQRMHPFDMRKYGKAYALISVHYGADLKGPSCQRPSGPIDDEALSTVHGSEYLASLQKADAIARAVEVPLIATLPTTLVNRVLLRPMRYACAGSVLAARIAVEKGFSVNLSGGYHHAKPDRGEGFCLFSDIALAAKEVATDELMNSDTAVAYIDLDAHQGNGVSHQFMKTPSFKMFDAFNAEIYPCGDVEAFERVDCRMALRSNTDGETYLQRLEEMLPGFLDSVDGAKLVIYNAGTDVVEGDQLGQLSLSEEDVLLRDMFVYAQVRSRGLPLLMLTSGGYSKISFQLIADSVLKMLEQEFSD